jgi:hypothetical protein
MSDELWIVVRNWRRFQHYENRDPPWIKNYLALLHDHGYLNLTGHQRAVLHGIWLEYASARCQLAANTASLTRRLGLRVSSATLEALNDAGFIAIVASKPLALTRSQETETDVEKDLKQKQKPARPAVARPQQSRQAGFPQPSEPVEDPWALR